MTRALLHPMPLWRLAAAVAALTAVLAHPCAARRTAKQSHGEQAPASELRLRQSEGVLLHVAQPAASIFLADPAIADIATPTDRTIFVYGKKAGHTSLFALDANGTTLASWRVLVGVSDGDLRALIRAKVGNYPVSLDMTPNGAVLSGSVPTPNVAERVRAAAAEFVASGTGIVDNLRVAGSLQVQLQVRVAEVSRSVSKELGVNWEQASVLGNTFPIALFTGRTFLDTSGGLPALLGGTAPNTILRSTTNAGSLLLGYQSSRAHVNALLDALASESLVRELAEPTLVATSGEEAKFLAGGQFPVPVGQGLGQVGIDYKNFGVQLVFKPTVVNEDLISLKVAPEVSTLQTDVSSGAITENGFTVPALSVRRAETTIELGSGQSFAIGGLLQNNINSVVSRFPGLGDIPILGALFRSTSFQRQETELVIIVTPTIVRPVTRPEVERLPTASTASPSDLELILRGKLSTAPGGTRALQGIGAARLRGDMGFEFE
jgi:pilus assembly protein CpaC